MKTNNMTTSDFRKSKGRSPLRLGLLLITLLLGCFALSPAARAVCQEGCSDIGNTFLGDDALLNNTSFGNTAVGFNALFANTTGNDNTAVGSGALQYNTTGYENTANGVSALSSNTTGDENTATGVGALSSNTTGNSNTATGYAALSSNTTGGANTASGFEALNHNSTGSGNTGTGLFALFKNSTGSGNTGTGSDALLLNATGNSNTATGESALFSNTTGNSNTANGAEALLSNGVGNNNTANGVEALLNNRGGNGNTANGVLALSGNTTGDNNTATGNNALLNNTTGSFNIALGAEAGGNLTTGSNNIDIGHRGVAGEADTIRIGIRGRHTNTFIAGIDGVTVAGGVGVIIDSKGHLGTAVSSERFKDAIKPMDKASEAILALKPVTFRYKHELDPDGIPQFGLVAEDVEKVNPALVARDAEGKAFTVRYEAVNAMLLNEFLKEHSKVTKLESTVVQQQKDFQATVARLTARLDEQASQIQKVSAQLEASKPAPQMVNNP